MTPAVQELRQPGRHTIRPGDTVRVAGARLERVHPTPDRGWSGARVLRIVDTPHGPFVEVTVPNRAGTRTVAAERLTRQRSRS